LVPDENFFLNIQIALTILKILIAYQTMIHQSCEKIILLRLSRKIVKKILFKKWIKNVLTRSIVLISICDLENFPKTLNPIVLRLAKKNRPKKRSLFFKKAERILNGRKSIGRRVI
jgi:hypothetical protein